MVFFGGLLILIISLIFVNHATAQVQTTISAQIGLDKKKFSIIIPIQNNGKYLSKCIDRIMNQSYRDLEIILVNSGSDKNVDEICRKYEKSDDRIKYIKQKNPKETVTVNDGISVASGDYIFCANLKEAWEKNFIKSVVDIFKKRSCDYVLNGRFCLTSTKLIGTVPSWGIVVKKEFLDKYPDVRIQEQASQSGDILFAHKVMALSDNVGFYESSVYFRKKVVVFSGQNVNNSEILRNIRIWLNRLDEFYTKYNLWGKKKLHLLSFINSELYGIYQNVQFSWSDRTCFFDLVHKFVEKHKLNERELVSKFSRDFYFFITSDYHYTHNIKVKLNRWGIGIKIFFLALNECKNESIKCIKFLVKFQNLDNLDKKNAWKDLFTEYQKKRNLVLEKLRREKKRKIRVCFLVTDNDKWNAQPLYEAMEKSEDFYPFIVVTRMRNLTGKSSLRYNIEFFESCCKNVKVGFDEQTNCGIDIKSFKPDIVFYQQPWDVYENQSPVHVLDDALSYYFPYAIGCVCMTLQRHINEFYLVLQKHFVFSEEDRQKCVDVCEYLDSNTTIAGHPKLDVYANYEERNFQKKYVIYAPHHSFYEDSILCYATFDWSGKYVLEWAKSHPELNWVFKPHPQLKQALLYYGHMTADEIEKYYQDWDDLGIYYNDGNYFDLFKNSRCLITDCGSFLTEYFPTKNPVIHLRNPKGKDYSADNKKIMQTYYDVWNIRQLRSVLDEVLLNGKDIKRKERVSLLKKMEIGKYRSTDKIMSELKKDLGRIDDNLYKK